MASTATYGSDVPEVADIPVPEDDDTEVPMPVAAQPSSSSGKRRHDGPPGDDDRTADPEDPEDVQVDLCEVPSVLMLGERRRKDVEECHPGRYEVCELFSQPRVSSTATARGLRGGWSLDLNHADPITGSKWDLSESKAQERVMKLLRRDKPLVVGLSPECTLFSALQNLRKTEIPADDMAKAIECVRFSVEVAKYQILKGRFFYFEHPLTVSSWTLEDLANLRDRHDVEDVVLHMCAFGLTSEDGDGDGLVKKPTRVLTNLPSVATALSRRCTGDHRHVHLMSGRAKAAAYYSEEFCNGIIDGVKVYLECTMLAKVSGAFELDCGELNVADDLEYEYGGSEIPFEFRGGSHCVDDVRGGELPLDLVREGRKAEIKGFSSRRVYEVRPRWEATQKGAKVVGVRWVDTLKGSKVRSRLVCQDFNNDKGHSDEMFAPTPPLAASRWLCSEMASQGISGIGDLRLMTLDFSKAFLYGDMKREVYIELPTEDSRKGGSDDLIGYLLKSMYGLRDAPQIWQEVVRTMLAARGYIPLVGTQCVYVHPDSGMLVVAHVDDFLVLGSKLNLSAFLQGLQAEFECTGQVLGYGDGELQSLKFLGRSIRLVDDGLEWEGDPRHAQQFVDKLLEDFGTSDAASGESSGRAEFKGSKTPGVKRAPSDEERILMPAPEAKSYRGLVALGNYMAQDRVDISFGSKEVSKTMSAPAYADLAPVKRLGRYLQEHPRCVTCYPWQDAPQSIDAYSDSDWGGDQVTRRSTSGGFLLRGGHLLLHWSRTQQVISLSSAEAELHAICKCASEGLAIANMSSEMLMTLPLKLLTDSSAARGIVQRQGTGKVKHLDIKTLWVQERETNNDFSIVKVPRLENWSDLFTHHWSDVEGENHMIGMNVERR